MLLRDQVKNSKRNKWYRQKNCFRASTAKLSNFKVLSFTNFTCDRISKMTDRTTGTSTYAGM